MTNSDDIKFLKVVIVGEAIVGKTTIRLRYLGKGFRKEYLSTLGADFAIKNYKNQQIQIWDLAGQVNFRAITKSYYVGTHGIIAVFDITRKDTLTVIPSWIEEFITIHGYLVPIMIIGNKIDLRGTTNTTVNTEEAIEFVNDLSEKYQQEINYIETSALTGQNIDNAFEKLVDQINIKSNNSETKIE